MSEVIRGIHYASDKFIEIFLENGKIIDIKSGGEKSETATYIAPGLVDLQINGYKGYDFNSLPISVDLVMRVTKSLWEEGVTSFYPTVITNSDEAIEEAVRTIAEACKNDDLVASCIPGIHLEGPFISAEDGPRGAHGKEYVKAPCWDLFQKWQNAAQGRIKIITISPEWSNAAEFIERCVENGVVVSIGHTAASPSQIKEAVAAGATMSTHLGNAAHLMLPRHPNYIWEQLAQDSLWACLIPDGFHLPDSFIKVAMKAKGPQAMLVSDAVYLSGLQPGTYETHIGGKVVLTPEGRLHMEENPNLLAGSAQMLRQGIANLVKNDVATVDEAWDMASIRPSTFMNLPYKAGIEIGAPADLVVFNWDGHRIEVLQTYKDGRLVYSGDYYGV